MNKILGVDVGGTKMLLVYEHQGEIIEDHKQTGLEFTIQNLIENINQFINELPSKPEAVGIALPGLVENTNRLVVSDVLPELNNLETYDLCLEMPVFFLNDLSAALFGEMEHYNKADTVAVVMVGTGIGVGIWENGRKIEGAKGWAGELGYMYVHADCGGFKTLDELSSGAAILNEANMTSMELHFALKNNEQFACSLIAKAGTYLGIAITNLIHMISPHAVVIGGGASTFEGYFEQVVKTVRKYGIPEMIEVSQLTKSRDNKRIAALGARQFAENMIGNKGG